MNISTKEKDMPLDLDCSDIIDIFKNHLKIENSVKSISHTFLNDRYAKRIDYAPYFQRKYVWDAEKASYFIESILLGTEIPPIVLFDNGIKNEVIDGRQRYETIKKFLDNGLPLNGKGLKILTNLAGRCFAELPENIKDSFVNTKIRILQFSIVNEPALSAEREDKVKKEIFTRYNSGIIALKTQEIERAAYIGDPLVHAFKDRLESDKDFLKQCQVVLMPRRKQNIKDRDKINYILTRIRNVLSMKYVPIQSYAAASSKTDVIQHFYFLKVSKHSVDENITQFCRVIDKVSNIRNELIKVDSLLKDNNLFYEVLYWALSIVEETSIEEFTKLDSIQIVIDLCNCTNMECFWKNVAVSRFDLENVFFATGSHYYMSIINRYTFMANYFASITDSDFSTKLKNKHYFDSLMSHELSLAQFNEYKLSKADPVSATVYDILTDVKNSNFIIRPDYQRSEVSNAVQKASYLMESILLGIRIPPIFIYRKNNKVSEVIDGQQRLLTILGFLREAYKNVDGKEELSDKHGFKLSKLRFLKELNGKDIDGVEGINPKFKDRILDFQIDIVEINEDRNPNFSPIDLFLRLNSKPFAIEPNTFEMWNAYVTKEYVEAIKAIAKDYSSKLLKPVDPRMKNEELITMLAYLAYREKNWMEKPKANLNIFVRNQRINARFSNKNHITNTLGEISRQQESGFGDAILEVRHFFEKIQILTGREFDNFNIMISHLKRNTQSRTNQNFYLLWIAIAHVDMKRVERQKESIFRKIQDMFAMSQEIKDDSFDIERFVTQLENI